MTLFGEAASVTSTYVCSSAAKRLSTRRAAATTSPRRRLSPRRRRRRTRPARSTGSSRRCSNADDSTTATFPRASSSPSTGAPWDAHWKHVGFVFSRVSTDRFTRALTLALVLICDDLTTSRIANGAGMRDTANCNASPAHIKLPRNTRAGFQERVRKSALRSNSCESERSLELAYRCASFGSALWLCSIARLRWSSWTSFNSAERSRHRCSSYVQQSCPHCTEHWHSCSHRCMPWRMNH